MNCISPPRPEDKRLLAYLDGEADQETAFHLQQCHYCRERAEALARVQNILTFRLYRLTCPSPIELGEYHLRMLPASRMLVVAQHLRECPHCAREIAQLEGFLSGLGPSMEDSFLGKAKVLIARLVGGQPERGTPGEPSFGPVVTALRGEGIGPLTFAAESIVILLDIQPATEGRRTILGQVAADNQDDWTGALVELRKDSQLRISSIVDDLGAFRCEGVMPGPQELRIIPKSGSVVVISNFEVPN